MADCNAAVIFVRKFGTLHNLVIFEFLARVRKKLCPPFSKTHGNTASVLAVFYRVFQMLFLSKNV